jgi:hypothetical protein
VDSKTSFVEALNDSIKKVGEVEKEADNEIKGSLLWNPGYT